MNGEKSKTDIIRRQIQHIFLIFPHSETTWCKCKMFEGMAANLMYNSSGNLS